MMRTIESRMRGDAVGFYFVDEETNLASLKSQRA